MTAPAAAGTGAAAKAAGARSAASSGQAARQRAQIDAIKAKRKPEPATPAPAPAEEDNPTEQVVPVKGLAREGVRHAMPGSALVGKAGRAVIATKAAQTGGGFVLGLVLYAYGLTYLRGGLPAVRALTAAKLFNKTA